MRVRAKKFGYYEHMRRREGDVFDLIPIKDAKGKVIPVEKQFSDLWMEKVSSKVPEKTTGSQAALNAESNALKAIRSPQEVI